MTEPDTSTPADLANAAALALASAAGAADFAAAVAKKRAVRGVLATLLAHELGASHRLMMRLAARADGILDRAEAADEDSRLGLEASRAVSGVARMMERYRLGILALDRLRGDKAVKVRDRYVGLYWGDDPPPGHPHINDVRPPRPDPLPPDPPPPTPPSSKALPPEPSSDAVEPLASHRPKGFGGQLRYGNPSGDLSAAPRCGAATRAGGSCRQPAMANGRCRLHGGKATGPRTAAGLARSRAARLVHGHRTAEAIGLRAAVAESGRRLDGLIDAQRRVLAWHGVDRSHRPLAERSPGDAGIVAPPAARPDDPARGPGRGPSAHAAAEAASGSDYRILRRLFGEGVPLPLRAAAAAVDDVGVPPAAASASAAPLPQRGACDPWITDRPRHQARVAQ